MALAESATVAQVFDFHNFSGLEQNFIAPEIHQRHDVAARRIDLARIVSNEIIPRLLRLHTDVVPNAPPVEVLVEALSPDRADVDALAHIVLGEDLAAAATYVTLLRERGLSMESLYIELLEPTARHLGMMWDNDECDFIDVTIGVGRLQSLLSIFNETYALPQIGTRRRVLMATTPGNQHSFGASMVEKLLVAAGWQVEAEYSGDAEEILSAVRMNWFAVIGLTAGSDQQLDGLANIIGLVRQQAQNSDIRVMVGGPMFVDNPELATKVGADATAPNAAAAVLAAQKLFDLAALKRPSRV